MPTIERGDKQFDVCSDAPHRKRADGLYIAECQIWVVTLPKCVELPRIDDRSTISSDCRRAAVSVGERVFRRVDISRARMSVCARIGRIRLAVHLLVCPLIADYLQYGYILPAHPPRWYFDVRFSCIQEEPFTCVDITLRSLYVKRPHAAIHPTAYWAKSRKCASIAIRTWTRLPIVLLRCSATEIYV